jgi:ABC-type multidrug transport system ATPase subunit
MPEGQLLEFSAVTKRFGAVTAVDDFSARVEPGRVTGFLGPNGAGKTTTLRILLGLVRATQGGATIGGVPYAKLTHPLRSVGAVLEASSFHPGRTAANHLKVYAQAAGLPTSRVDEALGLVGLGDLAGRKVGGYSLGMRQRLGLAYALLGDPGVLVLDEPANGLDPEGIKWMRGLLRDLADQGRTVLVSSHLLAEVQQTVDSLLILSAGRLVFEGALSDLADSTEYATVADSLDRDALSAALRAAAVDFDVLRSGLTVHGLEPAQVGQIAAEAGVALSALQRRGPALEEIFLDLVNGTRVHSRAAGQAGQVPDAAPSAIAAGMVAGADVGERADETGAAARPISEASAGAVAGADAGADAGAGAGAVEGASGGLAAAAGVAAVAGIAAVAGLAAVAGRSAGEPVEDRITDDEVADDEVVPAAEADEADEAASRPAAFAVASTGIIDIIPPAESSAERDAAREGDDAHGADSRHAVDDADDEEPLTEDPADADASDDEDARGAPISDEAAELESGPVRPLRPEQREWKPPAGWAEPVEWRAPAEWTGATQVVAGAPPERGPEGEPRRASAQDLEYGTVEATGEGDVPQADERSPEQASGEREDATSHPNEGEPALSIPEDSDRPWETYVKLESDVEADRFFGSFDDGSPDGSDPATPDDEAPPVTAMETPAPEDLGGSPPHWHEQPEPVPVVDDSPEAAEGDHAEDSDNPDGSRDDDETPEGGEPR